MYHTPAPAHCKWSVYLHDFVFIVIKNIPVRARLMIILQWQYAILYVISRSIVGEL